jgi:zinc protease
MIELLADALMRPRFDAQEFANYRDREIEFIKSAKDSDPSQLVGIYGRAALFGSHPYGRPQAAASARSPPSRKGDVVSYPRRNFGADRATLVFAGDLDPKWMKQALTPRSAAGRKRRRRGALKPRRASPAARRARRFAGSVQTYFWLATSA